MQTQTTPGQDVDEVVGWRLSQLAQAGFPPALGVGVAADSRFDLHGLIELVERGCPPALAVRILAPLDEALLA